MIDGGYFFVGVWVLVLLCDFYFGVDLLVDYFDVVFEMLVIMFGNVDEYLVILGDVDWNKIDFIVFMKMFGGYVSYDFLVNVILIVVGK